MTETTIAIPGYVAGRWSIDPVHSEVSFIVRHMMVGKVRGRFGSFSGVIVTAPDPADSSSSVTIDLTSIDTNNERRDNHIRSADFLAVDTSPEMTYRSTGIRVSEDAIVVEGELTLKGVTRPVQLSLEINGFGPDAGSGTVAGFSASGEINRRDFGVSFSAAMEGGGVVVGDTITIELEVEAVLQDG